LAAAVVVVVEEHLPLVLMLGLLLLATAVQARHQAFPAQA
jgi:hypothetical protein